MGHLPLAGDQLAFDLVIRHTHHDASKTLIGIEGRQALSHHLGRRRGKPLGRATPPSPTTPAVRCVRQPRVSAFFQFGGLRLSLAADDCRIVQVEVLEIADAETTDPL